MTEPKITTDYVKKMQSENTLLGCPFCDGEAFLVSAIKISQQSRYSIRCRDCLVETPSCTDSSMISAQWNTRITHDALKREVDQLRIERERYRGALERIAASETDGANGKYMAMVAREALPPSANVKG